MTNFSLLRQVNAQINHPEAFFANLFRRDFALSLENEEILTQICDKNGTLIILRYFINYILSHGLANSDKINMPNSEVFLLAPRKPKATLSPTDKP